MTIRNQDPFAAVRGHRHHAFAWAIAASIALLWLLFIATARATPVLDTLFGMNGIARIGGASGAEDFADAAARMTDGRIVFAGRSQGRASHNFAIRLTAAGQLDPTFGQCGDGTLFCSTPGAWPYSTTRRSWWPAPPAAISRWLATTATAPSI